MNTLALIGVALSPLLLTRSLGFTLPPPSGPSVLSIIFNGGGGGRQQPGGPSAQGDGILADADIGGCEHAAGLCSQAAWADIGFALGGIQRPVDVCTKYTPSTTCMSRALDRCYGRTSNSTATLLLAAASIVVKWCYDPTGNTINELSSHADCYSGAVFESVAKRNCLSTVLAPHGLAAQSPVDAQGRLRLNALLTNLIGSYQASTVLCMHEVIEDLCGQKAAAISLGPAMEQLMIFDTDTGSSEEDSIENNEVLESNDGVVDVVEEWTTVVSEVNGTQYMEVKSDSAIVKPAILHVTMVLVFLALICLHDV